MKTNININSNNTSTIPEIAMANVDAGVLIRLKTINTIAETTANMPQMIKRVRFIYFTKIF